MSPYKGTWREYRWDERRLKYPSFALVVCRAFGWASSDPARFVTTIRHAVDMGLNFLDTAAAYGDGYSEEPVSKAITGRRGQVVIATRFNFDHSRPQDVRLSLEQSLRRLNTDYIDVLQQHWPSPDIPLVDTIGELERLKKEGKIRAIGVSNWMEPEWEELDNPSRVDSLRPAYNRFGGLLREMCCLYVGDGQKVS
jgi:myo-inositol catabolism protein IolS